MHTRTSNLPLRSSTYARDAAYQEFFSHSSAPRVHTDEVIAEALRKQYPELHLTLISRCDFLGYANAGLATATPVDSEGAKPEDLRYRSYLNPGRRRVGDASFLSNVIAFGKFLYKWKDEEYILYQVAGHQQIYTSQTTFLLGSVQSNDSLIYEVFRYQNNIPDTVLVYDRGYWHASPELWERVQSSNWDDVILDAGMKKSITGEVNKFFDSEERYKKLKVPWKRGIIFHGPPGNGKTISIKAMMHSLYDRADPIPTLYVRTLTNYNGPEYAIGEIFAKARQQMPCFLVFEDLDSIVSDKVRSYFLNEVDGLLNNDGILMVGSTNHLERLDPGISKRPSRFDRKYLFPEPDMEQRVQYCEFWRQKLLDNEEIEFPVKLNKAIASITKGFSFAYMQEAFVAALLEIAKAGEDEDEDEEKQESNGDKPGEGPNNRSVFLYWENPCSCRWNKRCKCGNRADALEDEDLDKYILWREIKKVVKTLREELGQEHGGEDFTEGTRSGARRSYSFVRCL